MIVDGALWWKDRRRGAVWMSARPAGSLRPDGKRIISLRPDGQVRTAGADRVMFALTHGVWPKGRVVVDGDRLLDLPRRARSPGRKGGLPAERARDTRTLEAVAAGAATISTLASAVGGAPTNVRRRLTKLAAQGLLVPPICVPGRAHFWLLSAAGAEAVEEAELLTPAPIPPMINGHRWFRPEAISVARHQVEDEPDDETPRLLQGGSRRVLTDRRLSKRVQARAGGGHIGL